MTIAEDPTAGRAAQFHRLVPPLIGELSIVRHQVYWYSGTVHDRPQDNIFENVGDIEEITWGRTDGNKGLFRRCKFNDSQSNDRMKYIYVWWKGMLVHVRIRQHTEYVSILTSINFSRGVEHGNSGIADAPAYAAEFESSRAEVRTLFEKLGSQDRDDAEKPPLERLLGPLDAAERDESLFVEFDRDFNMAGLREKVLPSSPVEANRSSAETIIDFRGLITSVPTSEGAEGKRKGTNVKRNKTGGEQPLFKPCFEDAAIPVRETGLFLSKEYQEVIEEEEELLAGGGRSPWFVKEIGKYWRAVRPDGEVEDREEIEFTATGLLDGRAIFITHLTLPVKDQDAGLPPSPLRFFLHCKWSDERQIGRVVDRLCTMATARAALERHAAQILRKRNDLRMLLGSIEKSMDGLIFQNHILNTIILKQRDEKETAQLQNDLNEQVRRMDDSGAIDYFTKFSNRKLVKDQSSRDVLRALSSGMNALERAIQKQLQLNPEEQENLWDADNYMEYKVDRAAYHFDKFSRLSEQIRVARVEGFQTYPELVKRRMEDAFVFVRNAKDYLREIAQQRTRMSSQIGNITQIVEAHESDEEQRKIAEIQDFAEFALLTFLLPYYFGYILKDTLPHLGLEINKYAIFFWLIIAFTIINLIKRGLEGKLGFLDHFYKSKDISGAPTRGRVLTAEYWIGPKRVPQLGAGHARRRYFPRISALAHRLGWISTSINVLSILAIVAAVIFVVLLSRAPKEAAKQARAPAASTAGAVG